MTRHENIKLFCQLFGSACTDVYSAAGRVNIIGEHIDYCGGKVLPAALDMRCEVYARKNGTDKIRIAATTFRRVETLDICALESYKSLDWGNYQAGVAYMMQKEGYPLAGCDLLYDSSIPFGSGLSSSAAIEVATAVALAAMSGAELDPVKAAIISQRAESEYCNVNCGIMDQFASAMGKRDCAVLLDCKTLAYEYVPIELGDYVMVITDSNKRHSLADGKYNERRKETEEGLAIIKSRLDVGCLADVTPESFELVRNLLSPVVEKRVEHVVRECDRVKRAAEALRTGDIFALGALLNESHESLSKLYEVTGKELDILTKLARTSDGCLGSRMIGGGFGGCAVSIVRKDKVRSFMRRVGSGYTKAIGYAPTFYTTKIDDGIKHERLVDQYISDLICYAGKKLGLAGADRTYAINRVLRFIGEESYNECAPGIDNSATALEVIRPISDIAMTVHPEADEEWVQTELFDCVSALPSEVIRKFNGRRRRDPEKAFDKFYDYCVSCDYVKSAAIARNKFWIAEGSEREVQITINLSKPEKNNKQTAKMRSVSAGYPKCMICAENEGYAGQGRSRQTLRTIPLTINGEPWFWQFSPYAYFYQHGIAINRRHTPMTLDDTTVDKLADFIDFAPQYFIGCNAPLPIVGGSILAHEHFQGGKYFFPMFGCGNRKEWTLVGAKAGIVDWYNSVVVIRTHDRKKLRALGNRIINAWNCYDAPELDIIANDGEQHNTSTLIMRRDGSEYVLYIILRNNRCNEKYPDGIFHVHPEYMNIKSESIGLIEAMGMFILPARLDRQLAEVAKLLTGERSDIGEDIAVHRNMSQQLISTYGMSLTREEADAAVRSAVNNACENILFNTAVFKEDAHGKEAFEKFVRTALDLR